MIPLKNKLKGIPKPNIINLKECTDRAEWTRKEFARLGIDDINMHSYERYNEDSIKFVGDKHACDTTTKGVTSSHMLTIKWWVENTDEEYGIFFEDDLNYDTVEHWNFTLLEYIEKCNQWDWGALHLCNESRINWLGLTHYIWLGEKSPSLLLWIYITATIR